MSGGCGLVNKICVCLTCGSGRYVVRFIHTVLCIVIPANLIYNRHSDLHLWLVLHEGSYIYGFLYIGVLLASLIFYYCACLTDPGYVDQLVLTHLADDEEEEDLFTRGPSHHKYSAVRTSDPSLKQANHTNGNSKSTSNNRGDQSHSVDHIELHEYEANTSNSNSAAAQSSDSITAAADKDNSSSKRDDTVRMCKVCKLPQPLRSRHCEDCKRCVLKYDHHCPWLSTCVGEKNHKFFWLFLLFINIVIVFTAVVAVRGFPAHKPDDKDFTSGDIASILFVIFDCIVLAVGGISTLSLFGFHSYLMCTNQTTWESVSRTKISYLKKLSEDNNPFHLGYCCNIYTFCCKHTPRKWKSVYRKSTSTTQLFEEV